MFKKVIFKENVDKSSDWRGGGAVNIGNYSTPSFYYCTFDGNLVDRTGTDANSEAYGGAVFVYSTPANMSVLFEGCIFKNNMAKGNQSATGGALGSRDAQDRKSTRLNSSHKPISSAVFCLKKKN